MAPIMGIVLFTSAMGNFNAGYDTDVVFDSAVVVHPKSTCWIQEYSALVWAHMEW